jgi:pimeloyl-ACP methyl ester carboxylesterase
VIASSAVRRAARGCVARATDQRLLEQCGEHDVGQGFGDVVLAYVGPLVSNAGRARDLERYITSLDAEPLLKCESRLRDLQSPTLIVWGCGDRFFDRKWAHWLGELIPGTKDVVEIADAKLWFPDERATEFAARIRAFWNQWSGPAVS